VSLSFWFLAGLLVLATLALLLWPLLRQSGGTRVAQTALLREQLDALKAAHSAGLVDAQTYATRQQVLSAAALALIDAPAAAHPRKRSAVVTALALALTIPLATVVLYQQIGTPNALGFAGPSPSPGGTAPSSSEDPASRNAPDLSKAADALAAKLKDNPNDGEGWALLARTYRATERFDLASDAYTRARELLPEEPDLLAESAEALGLSSNPRVLAGEPEKLVDRALELNPTHQNSLFLKGLARAQADDPNGAEVTWERLLGLMEAGPAQAAVIEQLNIVRSKLGKPPMSASASEPVAASPMAATPVASAPSDASSAAGIEVSISLAPELAEIAQPNEVLFVFARAESGPPAPLAIQRLTAGSLPVTLRLDESMGMIAGMSLAQFPRVVIGARISKSGNAQAQPGDLETLSAPLDWRQAGKVSLVIDRVR